MEESACLGYQKHKSERPEEPPHMADKGSWYNGFSPKERNKKLKISKQLVAKGCLLAAQGPCALCGDPDVPVEYHDEDYGEPFLWRSLRFFLCANIATDTNFTSDSGIKRRGRCLSLMYVVAAMQTN